MGQEGRIQAPAGARLRKAGLVSEGAAVGPPASRAALQESECPPGDAKRPSVEFCEALRFVGR